MYTINGSFYIYLLWKILLNVTLRRQFYWIFYNDDMFPFFFRFSFDVIFSWDVYLRLDISLKYRMYLNWVESNLVMIYYVLKIGNVIFLFIAISVRQIENLKIRKIAFFGLAWIFHRFWLISEKLNHDVAQWPNHSFGNDRLLIVIQLSIFH